jgi:hypothetical protein
MTAQTVSSAFTDANRQLAYLPVYQCELDRPSSLSAHVRCAVSIAKHLLFPPEGRDHLQECSRIYQVRPGSLGRQCNGYSGRPMSALISLRNGHSLLVAHPAKAPSRPPQVSSDREARARSSMDYPNMARGGLLPTIPEHLVKTVRSGKEKGMKQ